MINPLVAVIQAFRTLDPTIADNQIASRPHYAGVDGGVGLWDNSLDGLVITLDGGSPELYLPVHDIRLEVRCFSTSEISAITLLSRVNFHAMQMVRMEVTTSQGIALIYYVLPDSGPSLLFDNLLDKPFALQFFRARIHTEGVE